MEKSFPQTKKLRTQFPRIFKTFFYEALNKLIERSEKCIRLAGEYIEKEK